MERADHQRCAVAWRWAAHRLGLLGAVLLGVVLPAGCGGNMEKALWGQVDDLTAERNDLRVRVERLEKEKAELQARVETLERIDPQQRAEALAGLMKVELGRRSGLFDKDDDGAIDSLVVYVKCTDEAGDVVKAPGRVRVELWDLDAAQEQAKLAEWTVEPADLKTRWAGTFMTYYYRLEFPVADLVAEHPSDLTVRVEFTDFATGRVFKQQTTVGPSR